MFNRKLGQVIFITSVPNVIPEIRKLVEELVNFQEVKKVKAIATNFPDLHWIDSQLEL
jgi:hypothetical protein